MDGASIDFSEISAPLLAIAGGDHEAIFNIVSISIRGKIRAITSMS